MDISNKALAFFLVVAMVVSIAGTMISLNKIDRFEGATGFASSDAGNVTLNVSRTASIKFVSANSTVDWGSGTVDTQRFYNNCTLVTKQPTMTQGCTGFNNDTGLVLENDGNLDVHVKLNISGNETMIAGDVSIRHFLINITENESGSCAAAADTGNYYDYGISANWSGQWKNMSGSTHCGAPTFFCSNLSWEDSTDSLILEFNLSLPSDTVGGRILYNLTATAESIEG